VYGTSIVQGGCASRPGMAYPAIVGRRLDRHVINLGFSGNGPMRPELAPLLAEIDASIYVIDSLPNMNDEQVRHRTEPFVRTLRAARPETPIVLVENIIYQNTLAGAPGRHEAKNAELRAAFARLRESGVEHLHLIPADDLIGHDMEAAVDGTHLTDLGFTRFADAIAPQLRSLLD
jgi:lysophospholipase L1-like esterase